MFNNIKEVPTKVLDEWLYLKEDTYWQATERYWKSRVSCVMK